MTQADTYLATKVVQVVPPADYGATAPTGATNIQVDTIGFKWARYDFNFGTITGTSFGASIRAGPTDGSGYTEIPGTDLTTVTAANDNQVHSIVIDCKAQERYHRLLFDLSSLTVQELGVTCTLSAAEDPVWATQAEVSAIV